MGQYWAFKVRYRINIRKIEINLFYFLFIYLYPEHSFLNGSCRAKFELQLECLSGKIVSSDAISDKEAETVKQVVTIYVSSNKY